VEQLRAKFAAERGEGGELRAWLAAEPVLAISAAARTLIAAAAVLLLAWGGWKLTRGLDASRDSELTPVAAAIDAGGGDAERGSTDDVVAAERRLDPADRDASLPRDVAAIQELVFGGAVRVLGRVIDEEGAAIVGARCELRLSGDGPQLTANDIVADELLAHGFARDAAPPPRRLARTDRNGDFRLDGIRHGLVHRLVVTAEGFAPAVRFVPTDGRSADFGSDAGGVLRLAAITLRPGTQTTVRVVDLRGAPVAGAEIHASALRGHGVRAWLSATSRAAISDHDGRAAIVLDQPGDHVFTALALDGRIALAHSAAGVDPIELRLVDGTDFRVSLHLADGTPLPGVEAQLDVALDDGRGHVGQKRFTDGDGVATFPLLPRGLRSIHLVAPGGTLHLFGDEASRQVEAAADSADFVVALAAPPIAVRFVDALDGSPVAATRLLVVDAEQGDPESSWPPAWSGVPTRGLGVLANDSRTGTLLLAPPNDRPLRPEAPWTERRMQDARFRIVVDAAGHAETWLGPFDPAELKRGEPLILPIERGTTVTLLVRDADGRPVGHARAHVVGTGPVIVVSTYCHHAASTLRSARADSGGRIELGPLAPGPHHLTIEAPGFLPRALDDATAGAGSEPRVVALDRGARVEAAVALEAEDLPDRFAVAFHREPNANLVVAGLDDDATAIFDALAPGRWEAIAFELDPARLPAAQAAGLAKQAIRDFTRIDLVAGVSTLDLVPHRLDRSTVRLDVAVIDRAQPSVTTATLRCITDSGERVVRPLAIEGNRVVADLPVASRYLLTLAEALPRTGDRDGPAASWVVAERSFTADELKRGLAPIAVLRGQARVTLVAADGTPWSEPASLAASRAVGSEFSNDFTELLNGEMRYFATTQAPVRELTELPVGTLYLRAECGELNGEANVEVLPDQSIDVTITLRPRSD
jgi:hypothetical protein